VPQLLHLQVLAGLLIQLAILDLHCLFENAIFPLQVQQLDFGLRACMYEDNSFNELSLFFLWKYQLSSNFRKQYRLGLILYPQK